MTRWASAFAWTLLAVFTVLLAAALWDGANGHGSGDESFTFAGAGFAVVGAVVAARRPSNAVGWLMLLTALLIAFGAFGEGYASVVGRPGRVWVAWSASWVWVVWLVLVAVYLPLLFPTGRFPSPRWRVVGWVGAVTVLLNAMPIALVAGDLELLTADIRNPLALGGGQDVLAAAQAAGEVGLGLACALAALGLVMRFRRAAGAERQQLKWFALAGAGAVVGVALALGAQVWPGGWRDVAGGLGWGLFLTSALAGLPVAIGIAILHDRLYDIDIVINRTIVYGALTAVLGSAYLGSVLVLQVVLDPITGGSDLAVAVSTLVVAGLFRPLRSRVQRLVDRRFYRRRYDGQRTVRAFAVRLRSELDLAAVGEDLRAVVADTVQPTQVRLWLRGTP